MSRVGMGFSAVSPGTPFPPELMELYDLVPQGISAELMARKYGITRRQMDEFGVRSHKLAQEATEKGRLTPQSSPAPQPADANRHTQTSSQDEGARPHARAAAPHLVQPGRPATCPRVA